MSDFSHPTISPWGYTYDAESLPDFIDTATFNAYTGSKFNGDTRITANIPSATAAIRNYCGWHVAPVLTCGVIYRVQDLRDAYVGGDLLVQLPATFVSAVNKVVINAKYNALTQAYDGDELTDFYIDNATGILRIYDAGAQDRKSQIFVKYAAGYDLTNIKAIQELTANLVTHAVTNPYGVNSEAAGGVSVSYSSNWSGHASATALTNDTREVLDAYKIRGTY